MARIVVSENVTVDGVVQDPTGEEGLSGGGWFGRVTANDKEGWAKAALAEALDARALLLGRRSYEYFAARWPSRCGPFADRLNEMPKYVASTTLASPAWAHTAVLGPDVASEVLKLKEELDGDIVVFASAGLLPTLVGHDLVDQLRLTIFPSVLGAGHRLLGEATGGTAWRLVGSRRVGDNLAFLAYERAPDSAVDPH